MKLSDIPLRRLYNERLLGEPFAHPEDAIRWLGAVQAQDFSGAKWALAQRTKHVADADITKLFNDGKILRTHVLRPTWHFVLPEDIVWMLELTAPRVKALMAYYDRKLSIDDEFIRRSNQLIGAALVGNTYLTRKELAEALARGGIEASGQRLGHIVMHAELDAVICSGPLRGKQFTYALLRERAPQAKKLSHDEALATLATRYFTSHGPATLKDFAWWSGLKVEDAKKGVAVAGSKLTNAPIGKHEYWFGSDEPGSRRSIPSLYLLPNYDEYLISYADYTPIFSGEVQGLNKPFGNALLAHIIVRDGLVIGGWRRTLAKSTVTVHPDMLVSLTTQEQQALQQATHDYATFLGYSLGP